MVPKEACPQHNKLASVLLVALLLSCLHASLGSEVQGPVRIIATGKAQGMPYVKAWMLNEPSLVGIIIPTREFGSVLARDIVRLMRIYFPRTFDDLISYEFLFLAQVDMVFVSPTQAQWMHDAIDVHGLGGVNTRSVMSMKGFFSVPWAESVLSNAFPNEPFSVINSPYYTHPFGPLVVNDDPALAAVLNPFGSELEDIFREYAGLYTVPRAGSRIHTWLRTDLMECGYPDPGYIPHIFEWNYGKGITFTFMDMVYDDFWSTRVNPYALDIITNVIWYGSHRTLPDDPYKVHSLRESLKLYRSQKSAVLAVFEFAEKFGANAASLYEEIRQLDDRKSTADSLYLQAEFDASYDEISEVLESINLVAEKAVGLKDQALFWIYLVEWLSVAGVSLICGTTIWMLMVRRRLYREARVTRFDEPWG